MQLSAAAQAGLDRFQAAFAATAHLSNEELRLHRRPRSEARLRRAPRDRDKRSAPILSRQYMRAMSTMVIRDQRLTPSAVRLATMIYAVAGRRGEFETTAARLGGALGLHERTIRRLLADLAHYGYVAHEITYTKTGSKAGLRLVVQPKMLPYYAIVGADRAGEPADVSLLRYKLTRKGPDLPQSAPSRPPDRGKG